MDYASVGRSELIEEIERLKKDLTTTKDKLRQRVDLNNKCKVFVAGPMFSSGSMGNNIRNAVQVAEQLRDAGFLVFLPHLYFFWDLIRPREREFWTALDLEWLETCNVIFRIPGESSGADGEEKHAEEWDLKAYSDMDQLIEDYPGGNLSIG